MSYKVQLVILMHTWAGKPSCQMAQTNSKRQRNILRQELVKGAQCSLRLPGSIPEDSWLTRHQNWLPAETQAWVSHLAKVPRHHLPSQSEVTNA